MTSVRIPKTNLDVFPLCLGGNVFGWTADAAESSHLLDGFVAGGGNFIDTADVYSAWVPSNEGGESETIIGDWMERRGNRADVVIATKVAKWGPRAGLSRANILAAADDSLRRLKTDYIDVYYAHEDDQTVELEESLGAFDELVRSGKVRYIAASNYSGARLKQAVTVSRANGLSEYIAIQNQYNLADREPFESDVVPVLTELGISAIPFYGLAAGFLTGKYQPGAKVDSDRAEGVSRLFTEAGWGTLKRLEQVSKEIGAPLATTALAWLRAQPTVSVPIASARTLNQLAPLMQIVRLSEAQSAFLSAD